MDSRQIVRVTIGYMAANLQRAIIFPANYVKVYRTTLIDRSKGNKEKERETHIKIVTELNASSRLSVKMIFIVVVHFKW